MSWQYHITGEYTDSPDSPAAGYLWQWFPVAMVKLEIV